MAVSQQQCLQGKVGIYRVALVLHRDGARGIGIPLQIEHSRRRTKWCCKNEARQSVAYPALQARVGL